MDVPLEVSFHNMDRSEAVEAKVREKAQKLERYFGRITSCRVVVEAPERRHAKGNLYRVKIELGVPARPPLIVNRHPGDKHSHEDVYVAVRDAFDAARRQLEDYAGKLSGKVKTHEVPPHGTIERLFPEEGYGFVLMSDGREIYFHQNAVVDGGFARLQLGEEVRVTIAQGESEQGPQASTVQPIGKHHLVE
ncbi:MAG: HPF/RaiA family ribosome-associated protein [Kiloniellales bacterium]